ncbi:hypothetical protein [Aneurinibacillus migulanus]|uniref:hypothetical protein n=1 Tax=Aneurinibacillus migulanus TaxID=47500 RepID=UPI0020A0F0A0|nr:hypothetical protein [Aneurinibacillus migulanus]MCP1356200.1 hypothetical protein [Aneurinibacillus migulanus]
MEEIAVLIFPLVFFHYPIRKHLTSLFIISILVAAFSRFIRPYIEASYSIFLIMLLFYILLIFIYRLKPINGLIVLCLGYLTNTAIMGAILSALTFTLDQSLPQIASQILYQTFVMLATSVIMFMGAYIIHKRKWQVNLESKKTSKMGRQFNYLIGAYSLIGMVLICQTITVSSSTGYDFYWTSLIIFSAFSIFLLVFVLIRNIKAMQYQMKIEEEKSYLEELISYTEEIKQINRDFYSQAQTLRQMAVCQNMNTIISYLDHLLQERNFLQASIEINEPMLAAFLGKERHVCQSYGVSLTVINNGYYFTPNSISGYQLNRLFKQIFDDIILVLKQHTTTDKWIRFTVDSVIDEETTFIIETIYLRQLSENIIEQIELHAGDIELIYDPYTNETKITIHF